METAADRVFLLAIDVTSAPPELAKALRVDRDDLVQLLDQARIELGELEMVVICTEERVELYGAGANWRRGFRLLLRQFSARSARLRSLQRSQPFCVAICVRRCAIAITCSAAGLLISA